MTLEDLFYLLRKSVFWLVYVQAFVSIDVSIHRKLDILSKLKA